MTAFLTVLRWIAFVASLCGWFSFVWQGLRLKATFVPAVTVTGLTIVLFTFGMAHFLQPAAWILLFAGYGFLIFYFIRALRGKFSFRFFYSPGMLFFFISSAFFIPILWGVHLYHYDNFSHWGTVLSEMLAFDDFPTAQTVVVFRDYMPGTASFLYWFCVAVGEAEDIALMGQALLSCAALSSLFFRVKRVASFRFLASAILGLVLTCLLVFDDGTLQIYNLLVDALIGFVAVSVWFLRENYRNQPLRVWLYSIPLLLFMTLLKNNAVLFLVFFALVFFYDSRKSKLGQWSKWLFLMPFSACGLWYFFWKVYRDVTYGTPTNSYSFQGISSAIQERTSVFYGELFRSFLEKISDFSRIYMIVFLVVNFLLIGSMVLFRYRKKSIAPLWRTLWVGNGMLIGYTAALLFMYCFIMSPGEAVHLAAFERYIMTPVILFLALSAESVMEAFSYHIKEKMIAVRMFPLWLSLLLFSLVSTQAMQLIYRPSFSSTERGMVMEVLRDAATIIPRNSKVAMYNGERGRRDLYYYLMMYELKTRVCFDLDFAQPEGTIQDDVKMLQHYNYLIIASDHRRIASELRKAGYTVIWRDECVVYRIANNSGRVTISPVLMNPS